MRSNQTTVAVPVRVLCGEAATLLLLFPARLPLPPNGHVRSKTTTPDYHHHHQRPKPVQIDGAAVQAFVQVQG
jgi:hypothetical protein